MLWACIRSSPGWSLEGIGRLGGVHKTPGMRWLRPLAHGNWQGVVPQGTRFFSGTMAVDAKWSKSAGVWWSLWVAVDHVSGLPGPVALWPSHATPSCARCL